MNDSILNDIQIFDDLIDEQTLSSLHSKIQSSPFTFDTTGGNRNHKYPPGKHSNGGYRFWGMTLLQRLNDTITYNDVKDPKLFETVLDIFEWFNKGYLNSSMFIHRVHINGQTIGQDGGIHLDEGWPDCYSLMIFPNFNWKPEWGGEFEVYSSDKEDGKLIRKIDYIPGRIILFNGHIPHRGLSPSVPNILRTSLIYKCQKIK